MEYREWIQQELSDLIFRAGCLEPLYDGLVKGELVDAIERMRTINTFVLQDTVSRLDSKIMEIHTFGYEDLIDARASLQERVSHLEDLVRELVRTRRMLDGYEAGSAPVSEQ